jgi:hypothetical protein
MRRRSTILVKHLFRRIRYVVLLIDLQVVIISSSNTWLFKTATERRMRNHQPLRYEFKLAIELIDQNSVTTYINRKSFKYIKIKFAG